jgi:hypothetical protein
MKKKNNFGNNKQGSHKKPDIYSGICSILMDEDGYIWNILSKSKKK